METTTQTDQRPTVEEIKAKGAALSVPFAGSVFGFSRAGSYRAADLGYFPTIRVGSRISVPTEAILKMLGAA